jgi:hypothetical protein
MTPEVSVWFWWVWVFNGVSSFVDGEGQVGQYGFDYCMFFSDWLVLEFLFANLLVFVVLVSLGLCHLLRGFRWGFLWCLELLQATGQRARIDLGEQCRCSVGSRSARSLAHRLR